MMVQPKRVLVVGPGEGRSVQLGKGMGVDFKVWVTRPAVASRSSSIPSRRDAWCHRTPT